ncbi:MAG: hypothetical protein IJ725_02025, partial [Ruminococcus sp.]|nr:hypothetical protein [Ruminococcus sp.]
MTELSALIQNEYKDISFDTEAAQIISMYNKQRRKKFTMFAGASLCVIMAMSIFLQVNPKAFESFMLSTREFFNNLFSDYSLVEATQPTTTLTVPAVIATETEGTEPKDSEPELAESIQAGYNSTEPTESLQGSFKP